MERENPYGYKRKKSVTIRDVAENSGVSATTVSRVLARNGYPVNESTRERVLRSAEALGYKYIDSAGPAAAGTQKGKIISVLVPTVSNPFYTSLISGMENAIVPHGYGLIIYNTLTGFASGSWENILQDMIGRNTCGIVVAADNMYPSRADIAINAAKQGIPTVLADCPTPDYRYNSVTYDYEKGSMIGTEYLIGKGHRNIVYAGLALERQSRVLRVQGFRKVMQTHSLPCGDDRIILHTESGATDATQTQSGEILARRILEMRKLPTAAVVINDMAALGMLRYFQRNGVKVPDDISIIGFDDGIFCEMVTPALTTVIVQSEQMGRMAAMLILDEIRSGGGPPVNLSLEPWVVERESVKEINN